MGIEPHDDIVIWGLFQMVQTCHHLHFSLIKKSEVQRRKKEGELELKLFQEFCPALDEDLGLPL